MQCGAEWLDRCSVVLDERQVQCGAEWLDRCSVVLDGR